MDAHPSRKGDFRSRSFRTVSGRAASLAAPAVLPW